MKILQIVHQFLPKNSGGTEIYTSQLCMELNKRNDVYLMFTSRDLTKDQYSVYEGEYQGLPFYEIINNYLQSSFEETYNNKVMDEIFRGVVDKIRPDVIHLQQLNFLSTNFVKIAKESDIPVVFTLHDFWLMCPRFGLRLQPDMTVCFDIKEEVCASCICVSSISDSSITLSASDRLGLRVLNSIGKYIPNRSIDVLRALKASIPNTLRKKVRIIKRPLKVKQRKKMTQYIHERKLYIKDICSQVDVFISPSRFLMAEFAKFGIPANKLIYSCHSFVTKWSGDIVRKKSENIRFGYIGLIAEHKGVHTLIEAFNRVEEKDVELSIYGDQDVNRSYSKRLKSLIKNPAIQFKGVFDHKDVSKVFSKIDVLVVPSICFETGPMAIYEAFLAGVPVICSHLGAMVERVRHGESGLLFKVGDPDDLYQKIKMIIDDRQLVDRLAKGIKPVKTIEQDAEDLEERYLSLLNQTRRLEQLSSF